MTFQKDPQNRRTFLQDLAHRLPIFGVALAAIPRRGFALQDPQKTVLASVKISETPEFEKVGGSVLIKGTPGGHVLIVRSGDTQYTAMSPVCPHKQCLVEVKSPSVITCPCHGSTYKIDGTYVSGPSKQGLKQFRAAVDGDVITVTGN